MSFDPVQHKARQRKMWEANAAGWEKWWPTFEAGAQPVSDLLCDLAHVSTGNWVLDLGAGMGEPALTAARRVGPSGKVTAIDPSPAMIAAAERRARAAKISNLGTHVADADVLSTMPEQSYDAVLSRWALMFMPSPDEVVAQVRRVLMTGGWFAAATWASAERVPLLSLGRELLRAQLGVEPPPEGTPHPFSLSDPEKLARLFAEAGLREVHGERLVVTFELASPAEYATFVRECSSVGQEITARAPERTEELLGLLAEEAKAFAGEDGRVAIPGETLLVAGRR